MTELNILMPMAGFGSRFSKAGFDTPKPIINVEDKPMFINALNSFDNFDVPLNITVVIRKEHTCFFDSDKIFMLYGKKIQIITLQNSTKGALETTLAAKNYINHKFPLVVMDCDLWFKSNDYIDYVKKSIKDELDIDGFLPIFKSKDPKYSYALIEEGIVVRTKEKKAISDNAIAGAYFFNKTEIFMEYAQRIVDKPLSSKEYYISLVYNELIKKGMKIGFVNLDEFKSFGTPEELKMII
ncbi:hypothetical protein HN836_02990 [Candidatus Woesearchaeota archaeon]|nr:hypothetical protein [Candidatus Woesearchaeota archaeon]